MTIASATWSLTVGGVSGPGVEPSRLAINDDMGAEIGDDTVDASVVANMVGAWPTTGTMLGDKMLESKELLNGNQ